MTTEQITIMLVDDILANLELLRDVMKMADFNVILASSGKDALAQLADCEPHLFALDVMMPEMDGFDLCRLIKADPRFEQTPVLFLSANHNIEEKRLAMELGAVDYIAKPYNIMDVLQRVRQHISITPQT